MSNCPRGLISRSAYFLRPAARQNYAGVLRGAIVSVLLSALLGCTAPEAEAAPPVSDLVGTAAAPRTYRDYREVAGLFQQANDTTYLINFWATWCKPCLEELPLLQKVSENFSGRPLRVILVSLDTEPSAIDRIPAYLDQRGIDLATVILTDEGKDWQRGVDEKWDGSLPTTLIYRGGLRYVYRRPFMSLPDLTGAVTPLIGQ